MNAVVPLFGLRCVRGSRSLGAITAARMRSSRSDAVDGVVVVTKDFSFDRIQPLAGKRPCLRVVRLRN